MLAYALVVAGALILARMLAVSSRSGTLMLAAVVTLAGGLALLSPPRQVGDSRDHVAMATAIAHASAPPPSEVRRAWFYALTAAPFVRAAETAGRDPRSGFTALNLLLLAGAAVLLVEARLDHRGGAAHRRTGAVVDRQAAPGSVHRLAHCRGVRLHRHSALVVDSRPRPGVGAGARARAGSRGRVDLRGAPGGLCRPARLDRRGWRAAPRGAESSLSVLAIWSGAQGVDGRQPAPAAGARTAVDALRPEHRHLRARPASHRDDCARARAGAGARTPAGVHAEARSRAGDRRAVRPDVHADAEHEWRRHARPFEVRPMAPAGCDPDPRSRAAGRRPASPDGRIRRVVHDLLCARRARRTICSRRGSPP